MLHSYHIVLCVQQHFCSFQFDVNQLSSLLNVSPSYLRDTVKVTTGVTPQKLIELYRVCSAICMFKDCCCVDHTCQKVGYTCMRTFYRTFKRITGYTPQAFIHQHQPQLNDAHLCNEVIQTLCTKHGLRITMFQ
ncbi:MAG: AraC family transcriptional regulator [Candidatus Kapabacteria bacterium]|nr:AraC family transcriptional regulator [Candidatus Kapabacteria bacterium]